MGDSNHNLASLIGSRICHDLISPVGAINNGLELLEMSGDIGGAEMGLIRDSVGNADARIRFFRIAFGGEGDQLMGPAEIITVLNDYARGGRVTLDWRAQDAQERTHVKLAFLAIQCLETALPFGGTITIECQNGAWTITGTSEKLSVDETLWAGLTRPETLQNISAAQVQFALMPSTAQRAGCVIRVNKASDLLTISF